MLSFVVFWPHISSGMSASRALSVLGRTKLGMARLAEALADGDVLGDPLGAAELGGAELAGATTAVDADGAVDALQAVTKIAATAIRPRVTIGCRITLSIFGVRRPSPTGGYA
jgi:hypothetical protein